MPYVVAVAIALMGLVIIRDTCYLAEAYGLANLNLELLLMLAFGFFLVWLGWFIFKETLTKTYTIRKR
ncbi:putative membrane protein [Bradyrhizobium japonicum]|nr:putative membrane protein [Bradyrhizobium japonicum]MCP1865165.1 putative membrane protein [Bradyrhizobium japonicum]MCP1896062.1 putative membrane protein [Bradyrhizobium japonicum]MCW2329448.1 putative membrane protein [Bradyrhizobium japonicum]